MDAAWTLDLLSNRGLDQSILLTVLLGLWLMLFFTETMGWVFIGVVVPGYLASIMVIAPTSAVAIVVEALVTLAISRFLAVSLARTGVWTQFFGRDRFFLIVLVSVWVRQISQTVALPALDNFLHDQGYTNLALGEDFSSIGLVLIPLTANMFWRLSLSRGLVQISTILGLTYALLRWVLLPYTNLTDANLVLLYEDSAIDFVSNAKSYIVLLTSAYLASRVNLKFGWDFGGILIAALLSLLWWTPLKLALTLLEALLLYWLTTNVLKLPGVRYLNLEGSRKLSFVFTFSFSLKCLIGALIGDSFPGLKVTDLFAFGYLISSILTVRMMTVGCARRVLLPVALTSLIGFVLSSLIGLWLSQASRIMSETRGEQENIALMSKHSLASVQGVLGYVSSRSSVRRSSNHRDHAQEMLRRRLLWHNIADSLARPRFPYLDDWQSFATKSSYLQLHLQVDPGDREALLLHPGEDHRGNPFDGPLIVLRSGAKGPIMAVHSAELDPGLAESTWIECRRSDCGALVFFALSERQRKQALPAQLSSNEHSLLSYLRAVRPVWHVTSSQDLPAGEKQLYLDSSSKEHHAFLRQDLQYRWNRAPQADALGAAAQDRVLLLSSRDRFSRISKHWQLPPPLEIKGSLSAHLRRLEALAQEREPPDPTTNPPAPHLSGTELRVLERRVVLPLVRLSQAGFVDRHELATIAFWARPLGLSLHWLQNCGQLGCFLLSLDHPHEGFLWAIALDAPNDTDIELPRPRRERGTLGMGLALFEAYQLRSILVHRGDPSFDPTHAGLVHSTFQAIHQGLDSSSPPDKDSLTLILRGFRQPPPTEAHSDSGSSASEQAELLLGLGYPVFSNAQQSAAQREWTGIWGPFGFLTKPFWSDASQAHHSYSGGQIPQVRYSRLLGKKQPIVVWLSSRLRNPYVHRSLSYWSDLAVVLAQERGEEALVDEQDPLAQLDEAEFLMLSDKESLTPCSLPLKEQSLRAELWARWLKQAKDFAQHRHPQALLGLERELRKHKGARLDLVSGLKSGLPYLALSWTRDGLRQRALVLLGVAEEKDRLVYQRGWAHLGPWSSLAIEQLHRSRSVTSVQCSGGRK